MGPTADAPVLRYYDIGPGVTAFSTTRYGGYSSGPYGGMNVNRWCGDDPETVARNMTALGNTLWPDKYKDGKIVIPHQTHGTKVVHVDSKLMAMSITERDKALESTDALMTDIEDVCIGVSTADCIPVLLYDNEHRAVCAVHAGWRCTVERCPVVVVGTQVYAASVTSVASVGASVWVVFHVAQVHRAASAFSGAAIYFYVIYEIGFCHILMDNIINILQRY